MKKDKSHNSREVIHDVPFVPPPVNDDVSRSAVSSKLTTPEKGISSPISFLLSEPPIVEAQGKVNDEKVETMEVSAIQDKACDTNKTSRVVNESTTAYTVDKDSEKKCKQDLSSIKPSFSCQEKIQNPLLQLTTGTFLCKRVLHPRFKSKGSEGLILKR